MINIALTKKEKYISKVNSVIFNQFDLLYENDYELIEVIYNCSKYYIPIHCEVYSAFLGLYMTEIPEEVIEAAIKFIFKNFKNIDYIEIKQCLTNYKGLKEENVLVIELPSSEEKYLSSLDGNTIAEIKQYLNNIEHDYKIEFQTYEKDISTEIVTKYYEFKKDSLGQKYPMPEQEYLKEYGISKAHVLYLDGNISAISFICESKDGKNAYYENFSYDKKYSKYSLGAIITYHTIVQLINSGCKTFYLGDGEYPYKRNLSANTYKTYSGIIKRPAQNLIKQIFTYGTSNSFHYLRILGLRIKWRRKKDNCPLEINKNTKCLLVAPHPDDDMLGIGELLIKYSNNFDCICMGSSGLPLEEYNITAKERSNMRIEEFHTVMERVGIENHQIFETYGIPRFDNQMDAHFKDYCNALNLEKYDYIFLPHPFDGHHEHRYITNKLFKRILKSKNYNPNCKIVFYEVWDNISKPNVFFDTRNGGFIYSKNGYKKYQNPNGRLWHNGDLLDTKIEIIEMYKSQWDYDSFYNVTTMKKCVNNKQPIWRYKVIGINDYLKKHYFSLKYGFV